MKSISLVALVSCSLVALAHAEPAEPLEGDRAETPHERNDAEAERSVAHASGDQRGFRLGDLFRRGRQDRTRDWGREKLPTEFPELLTEGGAHVYDVSRSEDGAWVRKRFRSHERAAVYAEVYRVLAREGIPVPESHERNGDMIQRFADGTPFAELSLRAKLRARKEIAHLGRRIDRILARHGELRDVSADIKTLNYLFDARGMLVWVVDPVTGMPRR